MQQKSSFLEKSEKDFAENKEKEMKIIAHSRSEALKMREKVDSKLIEVEKQ